DEASQAIRSRRAKVALVVPRGFEAAQTRSETSQLQLIVDGSDPQTVSSATQTAASLVGAWSAELLVARLGARGLRAAAPMEVEPAVLYNPDLRTAVFIVPGLIGVILTM